MKHLPLYQFLSQYATIPSEEWDCFEALLRKKSFKKGDFFVRPGDAARYLGFITKGAVVTYRTEEDGTQYYQGIILDFSIISPYASILTQTPSFTYIEFIEDTVMDIIDYTEFEKLYDGHRCWDRLGRKVVEAHYLNKERREYELLFFSAKDRYLSLLKRYPGIEDRVNQYHLAGYVGVTPSSLNKIIKKSIN
jgi:CRP-like cAMP-binding protein